MDSEFNIKGNEKAIILPFEEAGEYEDLIQKYLFSLAEKQDYTDGLLIYIPKNTIIETPIEISLNLIANSKENILIIAEENSKASIIDLAKSNDKVNERSQIVEIIAKDNSNIEFISVQNLNKETNNKSIKKASLGKDAVVNWLDCTLGSKATNSTLITDLNGQGSKTKNIGLFFGDKNQEFNFDVRTIHNAPHTESNMLSRGVLNDKAKSNYNGLIKIQEKGHNTIGYQKQETILLSNEAKADAVPTLEIHNDNVKCSHGTTISKLDPEKIFYLMSRGVGEKEAKNKIIEGFFESLIENDNVKQIVLERLQ
ncbi:MAG: Fe-S cluster assembly protein SufD [Candidatus Nanoarchaeia archaeon]|nr:Fe-S cluster assembly protein SufD [Candidatus Nanoarchaeia archaeon]